MKKKGIIASLFVLCGIFVSCSKMDVEPITCSEEVSLSEDLQPIIDAKCATEGCHVSGYWKGDYNDYETIKKHYDKGSLYKKVVVKQTMPKGDVLAQEEIDLWHCWIQAGAPNN